VARALEDNRNQEGYHGQRAIPITDPDERRRIIGEVMRSNSWFRSQSYDLDAWVASSPLVAVEFE
jgi:hypothetical protein